MNSLFSDLVQVIVEGYVRGCSGLFRGGLGRFLVEQIKDNDRNKSKNTIDYRGNNPEQSQTYIE